VKGYSRAKKKLDTLLVSSGVELKPWRLHDLRRTAATHMVRLSVSEIVVGRILNHAPHGVTAKIYALHSYEAEKRKGLSKWASDIDQAIQP
jgi:integrase